MICSWKLGLKRRSPNYVSLRIFVMVVFNPCQTSSYFMVSFPFKIILHIVSFAFNMELLFYVSLASRVMLHVVTNEETSDSYF